MVDKNDDIKVILSGEKTAFGQVAASLDDLDYLLKDRSTGDLKSLADLDWIYVVNGDVSSDGDQRRCKHLCLLDHQCDCPSGDGSGSVEDQTLIRNL